MTTERQALVERIKQDYAAYVHIEIRDETSVVLDSFNLDVVDALETLSSSVPGETPQEARLRQALKLAMVPLERAASYQDDKNLPLGVLIHAHECQSALEAIRPLLTEDSPALLAAISTVRQLGMRPIDLDCLAPVEDKALRALLDAITPLDADPSESSPADPPIPSPGDEA